jgi:hypothetical protein
MIKRSVLMVVSGVGGWTPSRAADSRVASKLTEIVG